MMAKTPSARSVKSLSLKHKARGKLKKHQSQRNHANAHMLPKPKQSAKIRFLGFAERCRRMSANPIRILQNQSKLDNEHQTHFSAMLHKWKALNVSTPFLNFQRDLGPDVHTVTQVLHQHQHIAAVLQRYLVSGPQQQGTYGGLTAQELRQAGEKELLQEAQTASDNTVHNDLSLTSSALIPKDISYFSSAGKVKRNFDENEESPKALEPLLELIVAFASDIPQHFYEHHLYRLLPHVISHAYVKLPQQIEQVFTCVVSLMVVLRNFIQKDSYKLYIDCFADLFSNRRPGYITDMAAQSLAFLVRKLPDKEVFFYRVFKRLGKDPSQTNGLGKLLTAVMKSNSLNRVHSITPKVMCIVLRILTLKSISTKHALEAVIVGLKGLAFFVTDKNAHANWQDFWTEDASRVWVPVWKQLRDIAMKTEADESKNKSLNELESTENYAENTDCQDLEELRRLDDLEQESASLTRPGDAVDCLVSAEMQLHGILSIVRFLVNFKRGTLLLDVQTAFEHIHPIITSHSSQLIGDCVADILIDLLKSPSHQACPDHYDASQPLQIKRNKMLSLFLQSEFPRSVIFSFARNSVILPHFGKEILPKLLRLLDLTVAGTTLDSVRRDVLSLLMDIIMHHEAPVKCGEDLEEWQKFSLRFDQVLNGNLDDSVPQTVPVLIEAVISEGLKDDLSNCEYLLMSVLCLPHVNPIDHLEMTSYLAWILHDILVKLEVDPKTIMKADALTPKSEPKKKKKKKTETLGSSETDNPVPELDVNIDVSLDVCTHQLLCLINVLVETMAHILSKQDFLSTLSGMNLVNILKRHPQYRESEHLLRAIDIYLSIAASVATDDLEDRPLTDDAFSDLYRILAPSLASPRAQTRLLVTHILSLFSLQLPPPPEGQTQVEGLFSIMYKIESVSLTALNFNERLRLMTLLDVEHINAHSPVSGMCLHAPILFAIGQLYVNLSPVWGFAVTYLASFANKLSEAQFWPLWLSKLKLISYKASLQITQGEDVDDAIFGNDCNLARVHEYLTSNDGLINLSKKVDHANARNLMWKSMHKFSSLCETKGRDIVNSFFEFMELEMQTTDFSVVPTENLEASNRDADDIVEETLEESKLSEGGEAKQEEEEMIKKRGNGKMLINSLCNYLVLFSKFSNLKCVYLASDLEKIFMDLLVHPSNRVQEHALASIFAFKHKHLVPYQESLLKIHSHSTFKSGVTAFSIDSTGDSSSSISDAHRAALMPLYIRLLYGKMQTKTGKNTTGRNKTAARKATVMRLLAGITDEESEVLLHLSFEILTPHLHGDCLQVVDRVFKGIRADAAIPLRRLLGILGTLDNMLYYLGNLLPSKKPYFLKVIMFILSYTIVLKDDTPSVHESHKNLLKKLKNKAMLALLKFFYIFDDYNWSNDEVNAILKTVVWPSLKKLPSEGVNNIHPMLKIFTKWSESEKYHPLFVKYHPDDQTLTPLPYIISLVNQPKCKVSVINYVLNIVDNLMSCDDRLTRKFQTASEEVGKKEKGKWNKKVVKLAKAAPVSADDATVSPPKELNVFDNLLPIPEPQVRQSDLSPPSYGTKILLPHTLHITNCLQTVVHQMLKKSLASQQQLRILCNITQFITDSSEGDKLLEAIIPLLVKKKTSDPEVVSHLLLTCSHLLPVSNCVEALSGQMLPLFLNVTEQCPRDELCHVFHSLAQAHPRYWTMANWMMELNSWMPRQADTMDIVRRLATFKEIAARLRSLSEFDEHIFCYIIYQCCHDINVVKDPILQQNCVQCLTELIICCVRLKTDNAQFQPVMALLMTQVRQGCRAHVDTVHCLYVRILGIVVRESSSTIKLVRDLVSIDTKLDFFNNVCHEQMSHRAKTLSKLTKGLRDGSLLPKPDTLELFIWPLLSRYLTHPRYAEEAGLLSAAIDCLGVIARTLPWGTYLSILKFFLNLLMSKTNNPKIALKVVSIILDAFHEDVSGLVLPDTFKTGTIKEGSTSLHEQSKNGCVQVNAVSTNSSIGNQIKSSAPIDTSDITKDDPQKEALKEIEIINSTPATSKQDAHNRKVYSALVRDIIPSLKKVFESRGKSASNHKVNKAKQADNDEIKKIPLALPLVKLLKKFPSGVLDANLGNVFYHLITFLQSHVPYIRRDARNMIVNVLQEVGGKYLPGLIRDLKVNLNLGFQKHVLVYTVKSILVNFVEFLKPEHIVKCISEIMQICVGELFTNKEVEDKNDDGEKKENEQIAEAKGEKSYAILEVLGRFVQISRIEEVLIPLRNVLHATQRKSVVVLVGKCLQSFMAGLEKNKIVSLKEKSILIYGIVTDKISQLKFESKVNPAAEKVWEVDDRMLLEPEPKRIKLSAKTTSSTNNYLFVDFAFGLLNKLLRANVFSTENPEHCGLLDPYISLLGDFIDSDYPTVTIVALKCFTQLVLFPLPSLKVKIDALVAQMFVLLNKYSSPELERGEMFDLVQLTFRSLAVIIKGVSCYTMREDHVRVLLIYMKDNLLRHTHQHTVFSLLQAIIARKINSPEIGPIMDTVRKMIVIDTTVTVLDQARSIYFEYLMNYPIVVKKFAATLKYFTENLDYPTVQGKISVCLMLDSIIANVPQEYFLEKNHKSLWLKLLLCLIQEEDASCRKHQQFSLMKLFAHLENKQLLVNESLTLMREDPKTSRTENATNVLLGCLSFLSFMENPTDIWPTSFFSKVLPLVVSLLHSSRFEPIPEDEEDTTVIRQQLCIDKTLVALLKLFQKLYLAYQSDSKWRDVVNDSVWTHVVEYLLYGEFQVRMLSCSLLGKLFAAHPVESAACPSVANTTKQVRELVMDFIDQFNCSAIVSEAIYKEFCLMSVRNLIYLIRQSNRVPMFTEELLDDTAGMTNNEFSKLQLMVCDASQYGQVAVSGYWVMTLAARLASEDINKKKVIRREAVLNLIAGVVLVLDDALEQSGPALRFILTHIARESRPDNDESLQLLVREVAETVSERLGWDRYAELLSQAEQDLSCRRLARRASKKERFVRNPQLAEEDKMKRNQATREAKKRKMKEGKPVLKRRKTEKFDH